MGFLSFAFSPGERFPYPPALCCNSQRLALPAGDLDRLDPTGETRYCHFAGTSSKPPKRLENAQTPRGRVHVEDNVPVGYPAQRGCVGRRS